jgi:DNA-binding transcriptional MerR regulator
VKNRFSLQELAGAAGVTPRTVRYYISEGLLPSPDRGPRAQYDPDHLARLRLIRQLQRNHLPLAEIRRRLAELSDADVHAALSTPPQPGVRESALEYVRSVLQEPARLSFNARLAAPDAAPVAPTMRGLAAEYPLPAAPAAQSASVQPDRSHWERVSLSPDVELHIRRPLTRGQNRAVSRLIGLARQVLEEE